MDLSEDHNPLLSLAQQQLSQFLYRLWSAKLQKPELSKPIVTALLILLLFIVQNSEIQFWTEFGTIQKISYRILTDVRGEAKPLADNQTVSIVPGSSSPSNSKFFVPNILNISSGTTVTWINNDLKLYKSLEVEQLHTVTSGSLESGTIGKDFDSGFLPAGKGFQQTFHSVGTFDYFCTIHPFMTGKIIVS